MRFWRAPSWLGRVPRKLALGISRERGVATRCRHMERASIALPAPATSSRIVPRRRLDAGEYQKAIELYTLAMSKEPMKRFDEALAWNDPALHGAARSVDLTN